MRPPSSSTKNLYKGDHFESNIGSWCSVVPCRPHPNPPYILTPKWLYYIPSSPGKNITYIFYRCLLVREQFKFYHNFTWERTVNFFTVLFFLIVLSFNSDILKFGRKNFKYALPYAYTLRDFPHFLRIRSKKRINYHGWTIWN